MLDQETTKYLEAVALSRERHKNLYGTLPYVYHLAHVEHVLSVHSLAEDDYRIAAYLHDILEDTETTYEEIEERFGRTIARIVDACTDGKGDNRRERKKAMYDKLARFPQAAPLKLADRIANVESCLFGENDELLGMYRKEHSEFRDHLWRTIQADANRIRRTRLLGMIVYLDDLLVG
jgi:(p)ppGpp synthase/HD superfamily hydrolase